MRIFRAIVMTLLLTITCLPVFAQEKRVLTSEDMQGIHTTLRQLQDAWNRNDMQAYAAQLTDDCSWVNIVGMHWDGKPEVMKAHRAYLSTMFLGVKMHPLDEQLSYVAPGVAMAVSTFRMDDFRTPAGNLEKDMHDRMTLVLLKQADGRWLIRAAHNTTINPGAAQFDPARQ